jgi:hypothetical protein
MEEGQEREGKKVEGVGGGEEGGREEEEQEEERGVHGHGGRTGQVSRCLSDPPAQSIS